MKQNLPDEKVDLGERGELATIKFLSTFGFKSIRNDLISYVKPQVYDDKKICGEIIGMYEHMVVEVKSRVRLFEPDPPGNPIWGIDYWAAGIEREALSKYREFQKKVDMEIKVLFVVPFLKDEKNYKSDIAGFLTQWLSKLRVAPKDKFFDHPSNGMRMFHVDQFVPYDISDKIMKKLGLL